ncbi:MAG: DUF2529 domain-containing protein [Bacillota bacterium]|nr:DUF2529 domain-containing protein [Bacillota bacterium]
MLKIFSTQLTGLFKKILENEEFSLEDGARLLAQAPIGDGIIYIFGTKEMKAVEVEALEGAEPLKGAKALNKAQFEELTEADRVLLISRHSTDDEAKELASNLWDKGIPFVSISTIEDEDAESPLTDSADVHIDLRLTKGLLPDEFGNRFGFPHSMAALFVYYGLKFEIDEMLSEYDL